MTRVRARTGGQDLARAAVYLDTAADAVAQIVGSPRVLGLIGPDLVAAIATAAAAVQGAADALRDAAATDPVLLSVEATAAALGIGRTTTYRLIADGTIRSQLIGRRRLVSSDAIADYVASIDH